MLPIQATSHLPQAGTRAGEGEGQLGQPQPRAAGISMEKEVPDVEDVCSNLPDQEEQVDEAFYR